LIPAKFIHIKIDYCNR